MGDEIIDLPEPVGDSGVSLEMTMRARRSVREYTRETLTIDQLGQLLWAAQGVTSADGKRTAPSAGALRPLEVYLLTSEGVHHYLPEGHRLAAHAAGDRRRGLVSAALDQELVARASAVFVIAGILARTAPRYGANRAWRYVNLEAGHAAQNLLLQAVVLGLGAVPVGAFDDDAVQDLLELPTEERPLYLIPVGYAAAGEGG